MAGGGPRLLGRDDCRPTVVDPEVAETTDNGRTGALILGGSDEVEDVAEEEPDDDDEAGGRAGSDGGCFS